MSWILCTTEQVAAHAPELFGAIDQIVMEVHLSRAVLPGRQQVLGLGRLLAQLRRDVGPGELFLFLF